MRVELSYEEKIINALYSLPKVKGEHFTSTNVREFNTIREILKPLYVELNTLQGLLKEAVAEIPEHVFKYPGPPTTYEHVADCPGCVWHDRNRIVWKTLREMVNDN